MDKPKTPWPLHVQEIMQRTEKLLEDCLIFSGFWVDTKRLTKIMRSGAAESFRAMVKHCESQPGFLPEQLGEVADEMVTEMFDLVPPLVARRANYQESVPAIREALEADLQAILSKRELADPAAEAESLGRARRGRPRVTTNQHPEVERYLDAVSKVAERPITIQDFCWVSGFGDDTIFGFWRQGNSPRCTGAHAKKFERTLALTPERFLAKLTELAANSR